MYESTMDALQVLYDKTVPGGFVGRRWLRPAGCQKAIHDFREARGTTDRLVQIDKMSVYWRKFG
jgi:O-methyltransferase